MPELPEVETIRRQLGPAVPQLFDLRLEVGHGPVEVGLEVAANSTRGMILGLSVVPVRPWNLRMRGIDNTWQGIRARA